MIYWLVGMSGAGKTTIGRALHGMLKEDKPATVLVDGDSVRRIFRQDTEEADYSLEGRRRNAERIFEICRWLDGEGIDVVCCILAVFPDVLARNRIAFSDYREIFVDVPIEILTARDDKGIYAPAIEGTAKNVVGIDIPFPRPSDPHMVIDNSSFSTPPEVWARRIIDMSDA